MTSREKRIVVVLATANVIFLGTLFLVATAAGGLSLPVLWPSPVPIYRPPARLTPACRQRAAQMLANSDLTGIAVLRDNTLRLDLVYRLSQDRSTEDAAQQVWTAFDTALGLADSGCEGFSRMETVVETQGGSERFRIYAATNMTDLRAYQAGELSEQAFIDRVEYRVERVDSDAL